MPLCFTSRLLACALLLSPSGLIATEEAPVYQSHFEDSLHQADALTDWSLSESPAPATLSVVRLEPTDTTAGATAALRIDCEASRKPVRIAQTTDIFELERERTYLLRVTLRCSRFEPGPKSRVRLFVTDSRWLWSSPPLLIREANADWHTLEIPFSVPAEVGGRHFRTRFEALDAALQIEIASIAIIPSNS